MRSKNRLAQKLAAPVPALPLDLFRIAAGVVVFGYLVRLLIEAPDIHGADGLVDHARVLEIFPFAWQPLFPAACPLWWSQALLGGACVSALAIAFGYRPRPYLAEPEHRIQLPSRQNSHVHS